MISTLYTLYRKIPYLRHKKRNVRKLQDAKSFRSLNFLLNWNEVNKLAKNERQVYFVDHSTPSLYDSKYNNNSTPTIVVNLNKKLTPPFLSLQWWKNWGVLVVARVHQRFGGGERGGGGGEDGFFFILYSDQDGSLTPLQLSNTTIYKPAEFPLQRVPNSFGTLVKLTLSEWQINSKINKQIIYKKNLKNMATRYLAHVV